jgi:hypothetical protein
MMNSKTLFSALALTLAAGTAMAGTPTYTVDALSHCVDVGLGHTAGFADVTLAAGTYAASVVSSTAVQNPAYPEEFDSKVGMIQNITVIGEISLGKSKTITVNGLETLHLFMADSQCGDNMGSTIVKFKKKS